MSGPLKPTTESLSSDIIRLKQKIPLDVIPQQYKEDQTPNNVMLPLTIQIPPIDIPP